MATTVESWPLGLPWEASYLEDRRFKRLLALGVVVFLVLGVAIPLVSLPEVPREQQEALPPHLARIVLEPRPLPPRREQPPPPAKPSAKRPPEAVPQRKPPTPDAVEAARAKAASSGLLQFQDVLTDMRDEASVERLRGTATRQGASQATRLERSIISARAGRTSGGIDTAALSSPAGGGGGLAARETTRVSGVGGAGAGVGAAGDVATTGDGRSVRSDESIRKVMDRNKGAIYTLYNRALRQDPTLRGKVSVQIVIEPDGAVSAVKLLSSELGDDDLERKLLARIRMIDFGAAPVGRTVLKYAFDFLPS